MICSSFSSPRSSLFSFSISSFHTPIESIQSFICHEICVLFSEKSIYLAFTDPTFVISCAVLSTRSPPVYLMPVWWFCSITYQRLRYGCSTLPVSSKLISIPQKTFLRSMKYVFLFVHALFLRFTQTIFIHALVVRFTFSTENECIYSSFQKTIRTLFWQWKMFNLFCSFSISSSFFSHYLNWWTSFSTAFSWIELEFSTSFAWLNVKCWMPNDTISFCTFLIDYNLKKEAWCK